MKNRKLQKTTKKSPESPDTLPPYLCRLPWETEDEYARLLAFLYTPHPRSIRMAHRRYCQENGISPKKNPPKSWYNLLKSPKKIQLVERKLAAIERARDKYGRIPDIDAIEAAIEAAGKFLEVEGLDDSAQQEINQTQNGLILIDAVFDSLAIDLDGNPIPGRATWAERREAYRKDKAIKA